jgi:hypothetical protein
MNRVWDHTRHDGTDQVAILALADWADDDGVCWYKNKRIGERIRRDERTVKRIMNKLRRSGEVFAPPNPGAGNRTLKFVCVGMTEDAIRDVLIRRFEMTEIEARANARRIISNQKGDTNDTNKGDSFVTNKGDIYGKKGDTNDTQKVTPMTPIKVTSMTPPINDPPDQPPLIHHDPPPLPEQNSGSGGDVREILEAAGVDEWKIIELLKLSHITADYVTAVFDGDSPNLKTALWRMERNASPNRDKKRSRSRIPPEYRDIIKT